MSVILTQCQSAPKTRKGKMKKCNESARQKMSTKVAEPKNAKKRSTCFKSFSSETLHAVLAVTSCSDLVACQINKFRGFFQLSVLVPLADTTCFIKTSFWKMSPLSKKKKKTGRRDLKSKVLEAGILLVMGRRSGHIHCEPLQWKWPTFLNWD